MRIKLDENMPDDLKLPLATLGHDVHTVREEGLAGQPDPSIWQTAQRERRFLITQDLDFSDIRQFTPGTHAGILLVRLKSPDRLSLVARIEELYIQEDVAGWVGCFVVATARKVRVARAPRG
jgi:predicted nuclease of predicted toxin-antitoxin system